MKETPKLSAERIRDYWNKVDRRGPEECWLWTGAFGSHGYGVMGFSGNAVQAKHLALILDGRPRPPAPGNHALHGPCSNRACVNPSHLRWGSNRENVHDMIALGRQAVGERLPQSRLTAEVVRAIRASGESHRVLAERYGITQSSVSRVKNGSQWRHVA